MPPTQADRSARTRSALLESAARGLSRYGYGNLILERVASEAGYTRGALYHQFKDKEDLALAVIDWVDETWREEVGARVEQEPDPVARADRPGPRSRGLLPAGRRPGGDRAEARVQRPGPSRRAAASSRSPKASSSAAPA